MHTSLPHSQKEERDEVQKEYDRLPKREELEHHRSELRRQCDELRDEISLVRDQAIVTTHHIRQSLPIWHLLPYKVITTV